MHAAYVDYVITHIQHTYIHIHITTYKIMPIIHINSLAKASDKRKTCYWFMWQNVTVKITAAMVLVVLVAH